MNDILNIDVNEYITEKFAAEMEGLEDSLNEAYAKIHKQRNFIKQLEETIAGTVSLSELLAIIREHYNSIKRGESDSGGWYDSKAKNQFLYIEKLMLDIFGIEKAYGWFSTRGDGRLKTYLAINYYDHKDEVMTLVEVLAEDWRTTNAFIKSFVMPYDYEREDVIAYLKSPHYCTNGIIYSVGQYWVDRGAGKENMPHNLILQSPYIVEPDVFKILIDTVKNKRGKYYYLYALTKYNDAVSDEQIIELGECLIGEKFTSLRESSIEGFVKGNMLKFNTKTLDYLYGLASGDNHFRLLHWERFPAEYQEKYILDMDIESALAALGNYSCKLTPDRKVEILAKFSNKDRS